MTTSPKIKLSREKHTLIITKPRCKSPKMSSGPVCVKVWPEFFFATSYQIISAFIH